MFSAASRMRRAARPNAGSPRALRISRISPTRNEAFMVATSSLLAAHRAYGAKRPATRADRCRMPSAESRARRSHATRGRHGNDTEPATQGELCLQGIESETSVLHVVKQEIRTGVLADPRQPGRKAFDYHRAERMIAGGQRALYRIVAHVMPFGGACVAANRSRHRSRYENRRTPFSGPRYTVSRASSV